jgi:hypothetical protein
MEVIALPIFGEYNDYGSIENIVPSETTRLIEEKSGMNIKDFIDNLASECNGKTYDELVVATKEENRYHYTEEGVLNFFKSVLTKKSNLETFLEKYTTGTDEEVKKELEGLRKYEEQRLKSISLCVIFELQEVYDAMVEIAKEKKDSYFWHTYKDKEVLWDKYYTFFANVKNKYGIKVNMMCKEADDWRHSEKFWGHLKEIEELQKQHGIEDRYRYSAPYHFVKCGGFEDYVNILYESYEGDINIFKEDFLNYAMFYELFIRMRGVFNFSPYGSQEYPYLSAIKLLKKEVKYLEQYVQDWKEQNPEDDEEEYLD